MSTVEIKSWRTGAVLFSCEVESSIDKAWRIRAALQLGVSANANLANANLTRANLANAYLANANLAGANLTDANLAGANLTDVNLAGAYLTDANLTRANLAGANLADANLAGANLANANLAGAKIIDGGLRSDGHRFFLTDFNGEGARVKAGCRNFTIKQAYDHWGNGESIQADRIALNKESLVIIEHMLLLAELRGWNLTTKEV